MSFKPGTNLTTSKSEPIVEPISNKRILYKNHTTILSSLTGVIGKDIFIPKIHQITGEEYPLSAITTRLDWDEKKQQYRGREYTVVNGFAIFKEDEEKREEG